MQIKFEVRGRPKIKEFDEIWDKVNKNYQEMSGDDSRVLYNAPIGTITADLDREPTKEELVKMKDVVQKQFEKGFSDVTVKII